MSKKKEEVKLSDVFSKKEKTEMVSHTCHYDVYKNGKKVGEVVMVGVPDDVSCGSTKAKEAALRLWHQAQ